MRNEKVRMLCEGALCVAMSVVLSYVKLDVGPSGGSINATMIPLVLFAIRKTRRQGAAVICGLVLDLIACNLLLKPLFGRIRPFAVNPAVTLLIRPPLDASFPSGHTAASFAAVFALKASGNPLWKPALGLAVLIAFSRLYLYVHWPSDVLGGALLGTAVGWMGAKLAAVIGTRLHWL